MIDFLHSFFCDGNEVKKFSGADGKCVCLFVCVCVCVCLCVCVLSTLINLPQTSVMFI